jgi:hypothetical protein
VGRFGISRENIQPLELECSSESAQEVFAMRAVLASGLLLVGALIGYSASGSAAQAESSPAGLVVGDVADISYPSGVTGANLHCTVTGVQDGYVRCKADPDTSGVRTSKPETWHNLRIAWQVSKVPKDEFLIR